MIKKIFVLLVISISFLITTPALAITILDPSDPCTPGDPNAICNAAIGYSCQFDNATQTNLCQKTTVGSIFGKIQPPDALKGFLQKNPTGSSAISQFLSNAIVLIYSVAGIVFIFMIIWGAFQWMTSGGDKEAMASAQKRIINAFIGIILFAVAFAIIRVIGQFTGFTFFAG